MSRAPHPGRRGDVRGARRAGEPGLIAAAGDPDVAALEAALLAPEQALAMPVHGRTASAVLVPLFIRGARLHAVLTRRRDDLRRHAGEISFPGGRREPQDRDLIATALREAQEEIGLPSQAVTLLGALTPTPTIATDFAIHPYVGLIEPGQQWALSPREVEAVLEPSLDDLRAGLARRRLVRRGVPFSTEVYLVGEHMVWGATARILGDLLARVPLG